ncbi:MAG: type I-B CRISPR-associated protein Cas8b1/Cst1 [Firmicutes bacterium HGW-Firmicutes-7]|nr:MAG: type I-B CRISPR-associated protein Cas8b1/Cst1 [Firmicutes bacterium HGW-Firmicutes-7]
MREDKIRIELTDWLFNAGVVGFVNILEHCGDEVEYYGQTVQINANVLDNFEEKYFKYFIDTYEKVMVYSNVLLKIESLIHFRISNENIDEKTVNDDIKYLKDKLKNSAYKDKVNRIDMTKLNSVSKKNKDINITILYEIKKIIMDHKMEILKMECIGYYDQKTKKSKAPNAIIDKYINTNMLNIKDTQKEASSYYNSDKSKYGYNCFACDNPIKLSDIDKGLNFLNRMYFDTARKTSHIWNFVSDIEICPLCRLIYYCLPAGFTTVYGRGIFINENKNIRDAVNINKRIRIEVLNDKERNQNTTFKALITSMQESVNESIKYELADIQVVSYENNEAMKYRFNILSKKLIMILRNSNEELNDLIKATYKENDLYIRIYEEVIRKLLNNENLFSILHKMIIVKISKPTDVWFGEKHIKVVNNINYEYLKGAGCMSISDKNLLKSYSGAGYHLKQAYIEKHSENKLNGIAYKLLNALKTNNKGMFMDTVLNCYLYTGKQVPNFFVDCLKETETFKTVGYAFVTGVIDGNNKPNSSGGN